MGVPFVACVNFVAHTHAPQGQMYVLSAGHSKCVQWLQHGVVALNVQAGV